MSRYVDVDDPQARQAIGRSLAEWYWRGVRHGSIVMLLVVIAAGVAYLATSRSL